MSRLLVCVSFLPADERNLVRLNHDFSEVHFQLDGCALELLVEITDYPIIRDPTLKCQPDFDNLEHACAYLYSYSD